MWRREFMRRVVGALGLATLARTLPAVSARWEVAARGPLGEPGEIHLFADPKFIGKESSLLDTTSYVRRPVAWLFDGERLRDADADADDDAGRAAT